MTEFLLGLVGVPGVTLVVAAVIRARRDRAPIPPGSRAARVLGCTCPRRGNWLGVREALRGECLVSAGCPVLAHRPERRRGGSL